MTQQEKNQLLRQYAAGEISWTSLRNRGFDSYRDVLAGLGRLHLRPPIAPMDGPNVEVRRRARGGYSGGPPASSGMTRRLGLLVTNASPPIVLAVANARIRILPQAVRGFGAYAASALNG